MSLYLFNRNMCLCNYNIPFVIWHSWLLCLIKKVPNISNIHGLLLHTCFFNIKHCVDFSFVFSSPLLVWRKLFSASGIFCHGGYQPGCIGIFWLAKCTSQIVIIPKNEEIPGFPILRKRTWVRPFYDFRPVLWASPSRAQISNHRRAHLLYRKCWSVRQKKT